MIGLGQARLVVSLCQIAAVRARMRCRTRAQTPAGLRAPCRSRSSWALSVWLIGFDGLAEWFQESLSGSCGVRFVEGWVG